MNGASELVAQQPRVLAPLAGLRLVQDPEKPPETSEEEGYFGPTVRMFENDNVDRFLRKARTFLEGDDFAGAIEVLQNVVEGRTLEAPGAAPGEPESGAAAAESELEVGENAEPKKRDPRSLAVPPGRNPRTVLIRGQHEILLAGQGSATIGGDDALENVGTDQAVFSQDGRIYWPVRRLCQQLLGTMPPSGLEAYSQRFGVEARRKLEAEPTPPRLSVLDHLVSRFFATEAAGRALAWQGDLMMAQGRYRGALQAFDTLLTVYPAALRDTLGLDGAWLGFKRALCMRFTGDLAAAHAAAVMLAEAYPEATLRVQGELVAVKDLAQTPLFSMGDANVVLGAGALGAGSTFDSNTVDEPSNGAGPARFRGVEGAGLQLPIEELVPLWERRFTTEQPYKLRGERNGNQALPAGGNVYPRVQGYRPGTQVMFDGAASRGDTTIFSPRIVFHDHFRVRAVDAWSGLLELEDPDGSLVPGGRMLANKPRPRVPLYDFAVQRVAQDGQRYFTVTAPDRPRSAHSAALDNAIAALDSKTGSTIWSTRDFDESSETLNEVTFLASPTARGNRLLVPVLKRGSYGLQCLDIDTGRPLWRTWLHGGGTEFARAPASPVAEVDGLAYVLTNAGVLACVDAFTGDLRWARRYHRRHPERDKPSFGRGRESNQRNVFGNQMSLYQERDIDGWATSDVVLLDGLVIFTPSDGHVMTCLDGMTGELVWALNVSSPHAPYTRLNTFVGHDGTFAYLTGDTSMVSVELRTGVRQWMLELPPEVGMSSWRGRGIVTNHAVMIPGVRQIHVLDLEQVRQGNRKWSAVTMPAFGVGKPPLSGPMNLFVDGCYVTAVFEGGIECFTTGRALETMVANTVSAVDQAEILAQVGELGRAIDVLDADLSRAGAAVSSPEAVAAMLTYAREIALEQSIGGQLSDALATLEKTAPHVKHERDHELRYLLARLDVFKRSRDLGKVAEAQGVLYALMERGL